MIYSLPELKKHVIEARKLGKTIVWTNGCFDIIHAGHVQYLREAATLGDKLVVGLNSDASVRQIKGKNRPVFCEQDRAEVLSAIRYVDSVLIFNEPSPAFIIGELKPDIFVKGGDYSFDTLNELEKKTVESYGGKIVILKLRPHCSTTNTILKLQKDDGF